MVNSNLIEIEQEEDEPPPSLNSLEESLTSCSDEEKPVFHSKYFSMVYFDASSLDEELLEEIKELYQPPQEKLIVKEATFFPSYTLSDPYKIRINLESEFEEIASNWTNDETNFGYESILTKYLLDNTPSLDIDPLENDNEENDNPILKKFFYEMQKRQLNSGNTNYNSS